jgi:hypothetical protein
MVPSMALRNLFVLASTLGVLAAQASCASAPPAVVPAWPPLTVVDTTGASMTLPADLARSKLTVLVFYSEHCSCTWKHGQCSE